MLDVQRHQEKFPRPLECPVRWKLSADWEVILVVGTRARSEVFETSCLESLEGPLWTMLLRTLMFSMRLSPSGQEDVRNGRLGARTTRRPIVCNERKSCWDFKAEVFEQDKKDYVKHGNDVGLGKAEEQREKEAYAGISDVVFCRQCVTLAACESGRVRLRLLGWRLRKLQGFVCGSPPGEANEGCRFGGTDVEESTAVNVGLQEASDG